MILILLFTKKLLFVNLFYGLFGFLLFAFKALLMFKYRTCYYIIILVHNQYR